MHSAIRKRNRRFLASVASDSGQSLQILRVKDPLICIRDSNGYVKYSREQ
jgi:hypothetical protein